MIDKFLHSIVAVVCRTHTKK